jgi:polysaccharide export outer membrane protein
VNRTLFLVPPAICRCVLVSALALFAVAQERPAYRLGANDQVIIRAFEMEELSDKPFRVDSDGSVSLPLLGRVRVSGLTVPQAEQQLATLIKRYVRQPQVTITVAQFRTEPVVFTGAFKAPGIYPLQGRRTLGDMVAAAGGLTPDASGRLRVTRRLEPGSAPLANAELDPDRNISTVQVSTNEVKALEDIVLQSDDVIAADRAGMVYVAGEVARSGSFQIGERDSISVMQAVTMAGGLTHDAVPDQARILRPLGDTTRHTEIALDVHRIFTGVDDDRPLLPNDVLYVPGRKQHNGWRTTAMVLAPLIPAFIYLGVH